MKIAVIQHRLRETAEEDLVALGDAAATATDMGAEVVVFPRVPVLADQSAGDPVISALRAVGEERSEQVIYLNPMMAPEGAHVAELPLLGKTALLVGDACMDPVELGRALMESPASAIVAVGAENDLQAEAVLELALGLSESLAATNRSPTTWVACCGCATGTWAFSRRRFRTTASR